MFELGDKTRFFHLTFYSLSAMRSIGGNGSYKSLLTLVLTSIVSTLTYCGSSLTGAKLSEALSCFDRSWS